MTNATDKTHYIDGVKGKDLNRLIKAYIKTKNKVDELEKEKNLIADEIKKLSAEGWNETTQFKYQLSVSIRAGFDSVKLKAELPSVYEKYQRTPKRTISLVGITPKV